jgi:hypothetical protein
MIALGNKVGIAAYSLLKGILCMSQAHQSTGKYSHTSWNDSQRNKFSLSGYMQ